MNRIFLVALAVFFVACQSKEASDTTATAEEVRTSELPASDSRTPLVAPLQKAHGMEVIRSISAVVGDLQLVQNGEPILTSKMYVSGDGSRVRMEHSDGAVLVYDGTECWASTAEAATTNNRFHLLTWSYFLMAPFKITDPGTHLEDTGVRPNLSGQESPTFRLTFDNGIGDTPEDWYVIYQNPETQLMDAMSYIVTFSGPAEEAEPHAIHYQDYVEVAGVKLSTFWSLYNWSEDEGFQDALNFDITFKNPTVVEDVAGLFNKPGAGVRLPLPSDS
ncbi:MAG TPA: hypothetical protein DCR93_08950 [Cytophagales bacterium]|nr:hypothetical protein [Cytophagales bacterium]HAP59613.1 hypothetical protein [Cytophagales bacterium]